jgi:hypothetical protein
MKLLHLGLLLLVPGALAFFFLVMRGSDSYLVYLTAGLLYVGLGLTLYASVVLWTDDWPTRFPNRHDCVCGT